MGCGVGGGSRAVINAPERAWCGAEAVVWNTTKNPARNVEGGQLELRSAPEVLVERFDGVGLGTVCSGEIRGGYVSGL